MSAALPETLNRSLAATSALATTELYNEGKSTANDPGEYPFAQIAERMDERTCPLCEEVDGMIIEVGSPEYAEWKSPSHVNCRRELVYINKEAAGVEANFQRPDEALIAKHGGYHIDPSKRAALRIPAEPAGRQFIIRTGVDPATGKKVARLDWAAWHSQRTNEEKRLILAARGAHSTREVLEILAQLGVTDLSDPVQQRKIALLGLRDLVEERIAKAGGTKAAAGASLAESVAKGVPISGALKVGGAKLEKQTPGRAAED